MSSSGLPRRLRIWLIAAIFAAAVPISAYALKQGFERHSAELRTASVTANARAAALAAETGEFLGGVHDLLRALRAMPQVRAGAAGRGDCDAALAQIHGALEQYSAILVASTRGDVMCASPAPPRGTSVADRAWFRRVVGTNGFAVGDPVTGRISGRKAIHVAVPVRDDLGRVAGAVAVGLEVEWLNRRIAALAARPDVVIALADQAGRIVASHPEPEILAERGDFPASARSVAWSGSAEAVEAAGGARRFYGVARLGGRDHSDLRLLVGLDKAPVLTAANGHLYQSSAISAAVMLIGLGLAWLASIVSRSVEREDFRLRAAVSNRELLLREAHHRVKNNMQLVLSSLRASADVPDVARRAIAARLQSMALVYNALLVSEDGLVDLGAYVTDLVQRIGRLLSERHAIVVTHADSDIRVAGDIARTVGLVVNEACTNAVKYAFPGDRGGTVVVALRRGDARVELSVEDNGVGMDERRAPDRPRTGNEGPGGAGSQLIENLALGIGATWRRTGARGTGVRCLLTFPAPTP